NSTSTSTTTRFITTNENMTTSTTTSETTSTSTSVTTTEEPTTTAYVPDDLKLRELKIVGYNINFKPNLSSYTIDVDEKVDELYIIASPADEQTEIETVGLVDIAGKDYIQIRVFNEFAKHEITYKINIRRNKSNTESSTVVENIFSDSFKLIVFAMLAVIFFLILFFTVKGLMKRSKDHDERDDSHEYTNNYTNSYANNYVNNDTNVYTNEYTNEDTEELIPKSEEELKTLFDELDKEQRK
ncbi:MAG: cadherin-like beta sandwich domain-containing protein, partial [Bacilli bacterium]|nr:cadherin-like beta sandwich domain-containing protein [Bacilli bacterium]